MQSFLWSFLLHMLQLLKVDFMAAACVVYASIPSHWIHLQAFCKCTVRMFKWPQSSVCSGECNVCCMCWSYAQKKKKKSNNRRYPMHDSVTFKMCIFSSQLANICTWAGMPTVPYWLPAVTQEDGKMEDSIEKGGERGEIKGVVMMWGHGPRGFLSLLFLICLCDNKNNNMAASKKERSTSEEEKGENNAERKERESGRDMEGKYKEPFFMLVAKSLNMQATTYWLIMHPNESKWMHPGVSPWY